MERINERILGTNMKKLLARVIARNAIPSGGGFIDGINFLKDRERVIRVNRESLAWIDEAIRVMQTAPDNPYRNDEEVIAGAILDKLNQRVGQR